MTGTPPRSRLAGSARRGHPAVPRGLLVIGAMPEGRERDSLELSALYRAGRTVDVREGDALLP